MTIPDAVTLPVATDNITDTELVNTQLEEEFAKVVDSTNPDTAAKDSEDQRPDVLILVADDDKFQCKSMVRILEAKNYRVICVGSGLEVLSLLPLLAKKRPDLILMDIMMPELNGIETTRRLKAMPQFAAIPVIMITGQNEKRVVAESLQAGACGFVVKPFERDTLLAKVAEALRG